MKKETFILGRFEDKDIVESNPNKSDVVEEKIISYVDEKTNQLIIQFVPVKKNNVKK